uniref:HD/PDEase domain-containing protein n=2 Tax=Panagrolaimus davidi TaxID=227884 RepID=A0A914R1T5_9BILA
MPVSSLIEWDYKDPKNYYRTNHGKGIGYAKLPKVCKVITDNPTFARLRYIKQLGAVLYIYPEATHTRHAHSLGTAHLACELIKILQEQLPEESKMTGAEMLCVIIAALCHDLGHAAFSHLCEEFLIQSDGTKLTHEEMSVLLFDKILKDDDKVRNRLERYLNEDHFNLIKEIINPPPFPDNSIPENLLSKKTFLYAIVNNPISGIDVDKLDYLLRDCIRTGVIGITKTDIGKFLATIKICDDPCKKFKWLAFPVTESKMISAFLEQRQYNHKVAYSHKNVLAINEM